MGTCLEIEFSYDAGRSVNWYKCLQSNLAISSKAENAHPYAVLCIYYRETLRCMHKKQKKNEYLW